MRTLPNPFLPRAIAIAAAGVLVLAAVGFVTLPAAAAPQDHVNVEKADAKADGPYKAEWDSLKKHDVPEWFRDAKFGIYFHWGVYSVPAFGSEWYPRNMHLKNRGEYKHHVETYGEPTEYPYTEFVPQFKAEKFDADEWADLFKKAGARYAGPVAEHHDGYAMWDSEVTPWNAADTGPKRDITGELAEAVRARGMRLVTSFHHARNNLWQKNGNWTGHYDGVKKNFPSLLEDDKPAVMYGYLPRDTFCDFWLAKLKEVVDAYQPDLMWFDSWLDEIPEAYQKQYCAYYFNRSKKWGKDVVVTCKQRDLPIEVAVEDFEKGRADRLTDFVWLTDDTISKGSWCYTKDLAIKSPDEVIDTFIDIVSKNGCLLLNISPKADGTIPEKQRHVLLEMGRWLDTNGEAIYGTRPWETYGEGPTRMAKGGHFVRMKEGYKAGDIRYTRAKHAPIVYAIMLGWTPGRVVLRSTKVSGECNSAKVTLLGHDKPIAYEVNETGQLVLHVPDLKPDERPVAYAYAFRLVGFNLGLHEHARFSMGEAVVLPAEKATLEGTHVDLEEKTKGRKNVGFWDDPEERVHWLMHVPEKGRYAVRGEFATTAGSRLRLRVGDQDKTFDVPKTGGWDKPRTIDIGAMTFTKPGIRHVILEPADAGNWNAVNVWQLEFARVGE
jgi:alpha-L-fucosidase